MSRDPWNVNTSKLASIVVWGHNITQDRHIAINPMHPAHKSKVQAYSVFIWASLSADRDPHGDSIRLMNSLVPVVIFWRLTFWKGHSMSACITWLSISARRLMPFWITKSDVFVTGWLYRQHHSTETAVTTLVNDLLLAADEGQSVSSLSTRPRFSIMIKLQNQFGLWGTVLNCRCVPFLAFRQVILSSSTYTTVLVTTASVNSQHFADSCFKQLASLYLPWTVNILPTPVPAYIFAAL